MSRNVQPSLFRICGENDDIYNSLIKRTKNGNKKHLTKLLYFIGEFNKINYQPMLNKYEYHRILLCLPGRHE